MNFAKIARDVGVDSKASQSFFQILEDTLVGFFLPAFNKSKRKSVKLQPKFYIFDLGVKKTMEKSLQQKVAAGTSSYGQAFEHFIICEVFRLNGYFRLDYDLSHYQTSAGGELGLVLSRNRKTIAIEIKSTDSIDPVESKIDGVHCLPWQKFFEILPEI